MEAQAAENLPVPAPSVGVTARPDPFSARRELLVVPHGWTIEQILRHMAVPDAIWHRVCVLLDDASIDRQFWRVCRPRSGVRVVVKVTPGGGGGNFLRAFLLVAVAVVAVLAAPAIAAGVAAAGGAFGVSAAAVSAVQAGLFAVGMLAVNALVPPPVPKFENPSPTSRALSISANQNGLRPFDTMPLVLGKHRVYPPFAARPFTELVGKDQYLRMLFVVGYQDLEITSLKIGETDLSTFSGVEWEIQSKSTDPAITLFTKTVNEVNPNQKLLGPADPVELTTDTDADEFSVDITFPQGLLRVSNNGKNKDEVAVAVDVHYRVSGGSTWTKATTISTSAKSANVIRKGYRFKFPSRGQYDVRFTRTTDDITAGVETNASVYNDDVYLSAFRSITNENPVTHPDAALVAVRIKATDQINGVVSSFNCVASSILPDWDGSAWVLRETNNPASLARAVLQGKGNARPLPDSRLNLVEFQAFHDECSAAGRAFNMNRDFSSTVFEALQDVCAAGRGRPMQIDGLWTVVRDVKQTTPVQHFTPRNTWGYSGVKAFIDMPHAFRVRFVNEQQGYVSDERMVYADGYSAANATKFETLELTGITDPDQVWKMARYHLAVAKLRPEVHTFSVDFEHIAVTPGDLIRFMHDTILIGLGAARIKSLVDDGTNVTDVVLDAAMPMATGKSYTIRVRRKTGASELHPVNTVAGEQSQLTLTTPVPIATAPEIGDLVMFGESGLESMELIVDSIIPGADLSATLKCYDAAPAVHDADTGTIPTHQTYITAPTGSDVPTIVSVQSDEAVLLRGQDGSLQVRILIGLGFANNREGVVAIEVQYRPTLYPDADWVSAPAVSPEALDVSILDVDEGESYDIRMRFRFSGGDVGAWSPTVTHTVVGKTTPPPDVETFLVQRQPDGTREFSWTLSSPPLDLAGYRIKYRLGSSGADWDTNMTDIVDGLVTVSPWETNQLAAGDYQIAIKAVDTGGRESTNALYISSTLGDPRIQNALIQEDVFKAGWPGFSNAGTSNVWIEPETGYLTPTSQDTWDTIPATWDAWTEWDMNPSTPMMYEHDVIDVGAAVAYEPLVTVQLDGGTVAVEERHGNTATPDASWSAYAAVGGVVTARYVQIRVTVTSPPSNGLTGMLVILSADTQEEEVTDLDTSTLTPETGGGVRIPITKSFNLITRVGLSLQSVGSGYTWEVIDKNTSTGPWVKIWNGSTLAYPVIDANVKGL